MEYVENYIMVYLSYIMITVVLYFLSSTLWHFMKIQYCFVFDPLTQNTIMNIISTPIDYQHYSSYS